MRYPCPDVPPPKGAPASAGPSPLPKGKGLPQGGFIPPEDVKSETGSPAGIARWGQPGKHQLPIRVKPPPLFGQMIAALWLPLGEAVAEGD